MSGVIVHSVLTTIPQVVFPDGKSWDYGQETVVVLGEKGDVIAEFTKQAVAFVEQGGASGPVPIKFVESFEVGEIPEIAAGTDSSGPSSPAS